MFYERNAQIKPAVLKNILSHKSSEPDIKWCYFQFLLRSLQSCHPDIINDRILESKEVRVTSNSHDIHFKINVNKKNTQNLLRQVHTETDTRIIT
jgi:hypothetical protein